MGMCFNGFSRRQFRKTPPLSYSQLFPAGQLSDSSALGPSSSSCPCFFSLLPAFPTAMPCSPSPGFSFSSSYCGKRPRGASPTPDPPWPHSCPSPPPPHGAAFSPHPLLFTAVPHALQNSMCFLQPSGTGTAQLPPLRLAVACRERCPHAEKGRSRAVVPRVGLHQIANWPFILSEF